MNQQGGGSFWARVDSKASAVEAAKFGGLPAFILGSQLSFSAVFWYSSSQMSLLLALPLGLVGLGLLVLSFRIRAGHFAALPIIAPLCALFFVVLISRIWFGSLWGLSQSYYSLVDIILTIIPLLALILSLSSLRGWRWLQNQN